MSKSSHACTISVTTFYKQIYIIDGLDACRSWKIFFENSKNLNLVEKTESHVVIFFLLFLNLLLLLGGGGGISGGSSSGGGGGSGATTNSSELGESLGEEIVHALASDVLQDNVEVLLVHLDTHGAEDLLDVGGGDLLSGLGEQKGCSNVTHD